MKVMNKQTLTKSEIASITKKIKILQVFDHPNIMKLYEVIENYSSIILVVENVADGDLFEYIKEKNYLEGIANPITLIPLFNVG